MPTSMEDSYHDLHLITVSIILISCTIIPYCCNAQSRFCRTACGSIPINYPLGIDEGCGSPYYRNLLTCSSSDNVLRLRTPSGNYPVISISYTDPHIVITDPSMWTCSSSSTSAGVFSSSVVLPFSLDASTRFTLSTKNDFLFFNCSEDAVVIRPRTRFCEQFPDRCGSACNKAAYLCRNLPGCPEGNKDGTNCCSYNPRASESLRLMLRHCDAYTSIYWRDKEDADDQVPEYGLRVDFEIPVTTKCLQCRDKEKGGGICGYETESRSFLCLCDEGNATTYCADARGSRHGTSTAVVIGTTTTFSVAGAICIGALVWYIRKVTTNKVVTCGVQTNENRLF